MPDSSTTRRGRSTSSIDEKALARVRALVRQVPDYPEPGVIFQDITPVLSDASTFKALVGWMTLDLPPDVDAVAGIEARGFILAAPVALALGVGFVPIRKMGKLPGTTVAQAYSLEYGESTLEMHSDALTPGQRVVIVDDVIATGGTMQASMSLVRGAGAKVTAVRAILSISGLEGDHQIADTDLRVLFEV